MKFKKFIVIILALSLFLMCGCGANKAVKLNMELSPNTGNIEKAPEVIKTNSTSISVSADVPKGAKIEVYLYDEAQPEDYIMEATINDTGKEAEFTNLSTGYNYRIGAVLFGTDKSVTLTIKYEEYQAPESSGNEFLSE